MSIVANGQILVKIIYSSDHTGPVAKSTCSRQFWVVTFHRLFRDFEAHFEVFNRHSRVVTPLGYHWAGWVHAAIARVPGVQVVGGGVQLLFWLCCEWKKCFSDVTRLPKNVNCDQKFVGISVGNYFRAGFKFWYIVLQIIWQPDFYILA